MKFGRKVEFDVLNLGVNFKVWKFELCGAEMARI